MKNKINWKEEAKHYADFLNNEPTRWKTEKEAKEYIRREIENIIAINGENELYSNEKRLLKLLNKN